MSSRYKDDPAKLHLGVLRGPHKFVRAGDGARAQLYDLRVDPGERTDLSARHPDLVRELEGELARWQALAVDAPAAGGTPAPEALRALGYTQD